MQDSHSITVFLFTDIEGSTRLWEQSPDEMHDALARHDAIAAECVSAHHGRVVKTTGDGIHAVFADPLNAVQAAIALQLALADPAATAGVALKVRCGMHAGLDAQRDNDFYGTAVNRAARLMSVAHGGQVLLSRSVASLLEGRLPADVTLRELGAVRLRDLTQPEHVYQVGHPGLREQFPALRSLETTPNNLPQQLTSFIGREHELAEVRRQLRQTRLLTVVGIGGLGKSRLALQVAADVFDEYPDGVWFVELAPVADPRLVPQVIASVLGVKEDAGNPVLEALVKFARERRMLLVLDNCEHLIGACADIARKLLEAGPHVRILASSRERLGVRGEKIFPLAPLAAPLPQQGLSPEPLGQFASVRLFVDRARDALPDFAVSLENADSVAAICHSLDGIPLALELAAARVRAMPVQKIAERLSDRFKLLSGGDRTALPRQQTLRALIDWSYELLDAREQLLFRRLSVSQGGFSLEAAEQIGAGDAIAHSDVLDVLTQLVEKSLVILDGERYRQLETVRQYAQDRLRDSGEEDAVRERHLAYYLAFAEAAYPMLFGPQQGDWLRKLDAERENLLAAHAQCEHASDGAERGLRLASFTKPYWASRGLLRLAHALIVEALGRAAKDAHTPERWRAMFDLGQLSYMIGEHAQAQGALEENLRVARDRSDRGGVAMVLQPLGAVLVARGDLANARKHLYEALEMAREIGKKREVAAALTWLAVLHRLDDDIDGAEPLYREVLQLSRERGDRASIAIGLLNLAIVAISRGNAAAAADMIREAGTLADETGSVPVSQSVLEVAAGLAASRQDWSRAAVLFGAAEAVARTTGLQRDAADAKFLLPLMDRTRQALGDTRFAAALSSGQRLSPEARMSELRGSLGKEA